MHENLETTGQKELHQQREDQLVVARTYVDSFIEKKGSDRITPESRMHACCSVCNQKSNENLFIKNQGEYFFCKHCAHVFLGNPFAEKTMLDYYNGYPPSSLEWHQNESDYYRRIYNSGLDMLTKSIGENPGRSTILDVGCSSGFFMSIAEERLIEAYGVEPNVIESKHAKSKGLKVLGKTIDEIESHKKFDSITLWDVLEHINDPVMLIKRFRSLLKTGGVIFVQVPSSQSLAARIMREHCNMYDGIEHITLFSAKSLEHAFSKAGFDLVTMQSVISESYAVRNYLNYEVNPYLNTEHAELSVPDLLSGKEIVSGMLGYKLQGVFMIK